MHREQVFQFDLGTTTATLNGWTSTDFYIHCADSLPLYVQDATYSPDDSTVWIAFTGYKQPSDPLHTGVCDATAAYPSTAGIVSRTWVNYTGCDVAGTGAGCRPGVGGISPATDRAPAGTCERGIGTDDLVLRFHGLSIAERPQERRDPVLPRVPAGICFLPYPDRAGVRMNGVRSPEATPKGRSLTRSARAAGHAAAAAAPVRVHTQDRQDEWTATPAGGKRRPRSGRSPARSRARRIAGLVRSQCVDESADVQR